MTDSETFSCRYYLARDEGNGWPSKVLDGGHDTPEGVAKAAKLYERIFRDKGPWVMVEVHPLPDSDPPINDQAAQDCAYLIAEFGP